MAKHYSYNIFYFHLYVIEAAWKHISLQSFVISQDRQYHFFIRQIFTETVVDTITERGVKGYSWEQERPLWCVQLCGQDSLEFLG